MFIADYEKKTGEYYVFGRQINASANPCLVNESIKSFWKGFCCQSSEIEITAVNDLSFQIGNAHKPMLDGNQYAVNVEKTGLCITGDSEKGLINGFMTLLHKIKTKMITEREAVFEIPCGVFKEKPLIPNQMVHFCVFPETRLWEIERFIRFCTALKYSHIVLEFWGMLKYDCLKELGWSFAYSKEQLRPLITMANELGIEIIPMFNHWGHASGSRSIYGKHVVLDQNPALQPLFGDDGWTWDIQNPDTLKLLRNIREELMDLCGEGKYFHLGCDEAYNFEITTENYTVLTDYLNGIAAELAKVGRRPIIWNDMLIFNRDTFNKNNPYGVSCKNEELEKCLLADLDRNIIIADAQYYVTETPVETALISDNAGFDTLLCPWHRFCGNSVTPCVETAAEYDLFGVMHTTWHTLSIGMPDVARAAFHIWNSPGKPEPPHTFFDTNTAKIMRKVYPVNGDYEKAGWSKKQVGDMLR